MEMSAVISNLYFSKTQQVLVQSSGHFLRIAWFYHQNLSIPNSVPPNNVLARLQNDYLKKITEKLCGTEKSNR